MSDEIIEKKDAPKVIMLPPMLLLMHICAGIVLNWIFPFSIGHFWGWIGLALLGSAFGITHWARKTFEAAKTNVAPNLPATTIVEDGPFKYTRNPMYLSFIIGFIGLSLLADAPMMLLLVFPLFFILENRVIKPEEEYLTEKFGDTYTTYSASARRWL